MLFLHIFVQLPYFHSQMLRLKPKYEFKTHSDSTLLNELLTKKAIMAQVIV